MNAFRFNFSGTDDKKYEKQGIQEEIIWFESEEIIPNKQIKELDENVTYAKMYTCDDVEIGYVNNCIDKISTNKDYNAVELAEKEHSDLVPGKYEGGLKVWECTNDLIKYLLENHDTINFKQAKVLDLGCGVGILGIYALQNGSFVTFQDYNKEIIECVTIPSVLLNIEEELREYEMKKCKFYSGDWESFNKKLDSSEVYDIILTSETIYNEANYDKLIELFLKRLSNNGTIYVAAKTCYFGVGGGMRLFESYITRSGLLHSKVVKKMSGGVQREILKIEKI